ncbi:MAG: DNA recombination protein RmuC [Bacilli bacterium]|nr:DNA recombination protein RmuC [Bacilli bacterium]
MEYIIIGLLIVLLILVVISLMKNINEGNITERLGRFETNITKEIGDFKSDFSRNLNKDFNELNDKIEDRLIKINDKVNNRLDENFERTNKTFASVLERLSKIDEAQKKIETLSSDIVSLQSILTDKKTRGTFGEVNLNNILSSVFGENNTKIYELQHKFDNGNIADAVLYAPEPLGLVAIDSKFPLENYQNMVNKNISKIEREIYEKKFKSDVKKHIDAIRDKYIIPGVTSDQAFMFLPAEALFAELNAYHQDIIEYAYKSRVWITSPTTLMSMLTVVQTVIKNMERDKYAVIIQKELQALSVEFGRYKERWDSLQKSIERVSKDVKEVNVTTEKISNKFESINKVEVDKFLTNKDE